MKNKAIKKKFVYSLFAVLLILSLYSSITVFASYDYFSGSAGYSWRRVGGRTVKEDSIGSVSRYNWQTSSQAGKHNMWFETVNSNGQQKANGLVPYLQNRTYKSSAQYGHYYYLNAGRENAVDPVTKVTGKWYP